MKNLPLLKALERYLESSCRATYVQERDDYLTDLLNAKEDEEKVINRKLDELDKRLIVNLSVRSFCKKYDTPLGLS